MSPCSLITIKVVEVTKDRVTPFCEGFLGQGWLRLFKHHHPIISLCMFQELKVGRAKWLSVIGHLLMLI